MNGGNFDPRPVDVVMDLTHGTRRLIGGYWGQFVIAYSCLGGILKQGSIEPITVEYFA